LINGESKKQNGAYSGMKYIMPLTLAAFLSGCTTLLASEINRHREKNDGCNLTQCADLIETAIVDIAMGVKIAQEVIDQRSSKAQVPEQVDTGNVDCGVAEEKICSVSRGCYCRPQNVGDNIQ
jgi:hypothetical protein